jgi:hypothetical protein
LEGSNWSDTVQDFKLKLFQLTDLPPAQQHLINGPEVLSEPNATLQHYGVTPSQPLTLHEVPLTEDEDYLEIIGDAASRQEDRNAGFGNTRLGGARRKAETEVAKESTVPWSCSSCTFVNPALFLACEQCNAPRPAPQSPLKRPREELMQADAPAHGQDPASDASKPPIQVIVDDPMEVDSRNVAEVNDGEEYLTKRETAEARQFADELADDLETTEPPSKRLRANKSSKIPVEPVKSPGSRMNLVLEESDEDYKNDSSPVKRDRRKR